MNNWERGRPRPLFGMLMHNRSALINLTILFVLAAGLAACGGQGLSGEDAASAVTVIGRHGREPGTFSFPRGISIARDGRVAISDKTGRIQILAPDGRCLVWWTIPKIDNGTPTGIAFDETNSTSTTLVVADTHNSRIIRYALDGKLLAMWGEYGSVPGKMVYPTAIAIDGKGTIYLTEYGENLDRVLKYAPDGRFIKQWGTFGTGPGQFQRPMGIALTPDGKVLVADSCNHRLQLFTAEGELIKVIGALGRDPDKFNYPYDLVLDKAGRIFIVEFGNNRLHVLDKDGKTLGVFGGPGAEPGRFGEPWGIDLAPDGKLWIADTFNHRLQVFKPEVVMSLK